MISGNYLDRKSDNRFALHIKKVRAGALYALLLTFAMIPMAHADSINGVNSQGNTLPIGANGVTVETITGSTKEADFAGPVTAASLGVGGAGSFGGTLGVSGLLTAGSGVEVGTEGTGSFMPVGHSEFGPTLSIGGATTNNTDPIYFQRYNENYDTTSLRLVIGDNSGQPYVPGGPGTLGDGDAFIIGALNSADGSYGWVPHFTFTSEGKVGIGTTAPQGTLDVKNPAGNASICLNGQCVSTWSDVLKIALANMYTVSSEYTAGEGTKTVSCNGTDARVGCGYFTNTEDGMTLIETNLAQPSGTNGCTLTTPENVDHWAVAAYCVP